MKTGKDIIDTELEKSFNELDGLHLAQHIGETLKGLGSPDVKIWNKDDYFSFYRNEGIRILTKHRAVTPEQAGKIYDQKFKEVCNEYSDFDIDKIFKPKMELQKVLYPEEFILLGGIEDVNKTYSEVQNDFQGEPEVKHEKKWLVIFYWICHYCRNSFIFCTCQIRNKTMKFKCNNCGEIDSIHVKDTSTSVLAMAYGPKACE